MKKIIRKFLGIFVAVAVVIPCLSTGVSAASSVTLDVSIDNISHEVSQTLYGMFIEDISKAGDGGLVANLVYNNSFEYNDTDEENASLNEAYWLFDNLTHELSQEDPMNDVNTYYEIITVDGTGTLTNIGCVEDWDYQTWNVNTELQSTPDMGFKEDTDYEFYVWLKNVDYEGTITVYLNSDHNSESSRVEVDITDLSADEWSKFSATLTSSYEEDGALSIEFNGTGTLLVDFASLVSHDSYGYGTEEYQFASLRSDLVQAIIDMNPSFIRFPGGCYAEGRSIDILYDWKSTIGPVEERTQTYNIWGNDSAGDYYITSNQLGYMEYLNLCADIGAEPVPCLNAGMICQNSCNYWYNYDAYLRLTMTDDEWYEYCVTVYNYAEDDEEGIAERAEICDALGYESEDDWYAYVETIALTPGTEEFDDYVQDILDLIEFCNGDTDTYWGALRAEYGHEEPYNLKYIEIGNENWGIIYWRNFAAIYEAIKEVYPDIIVITTSGTTSSGYDYEYAWELVNEEYTDCYVDEHYYTASSYLYSINDRYDSYDRDGAKVFLGEWTATADGWGTLQTKSNITEALEEAVYMTAFERNSDIVAMTCLAPTFAKNNSQNWAINEIWFDSQDICLTPSYYTQMLFNNNLGTEYITASFSEDLELTELAQSVTVDTEEQVIYIKIVNPSSSSRSVTINLDGFEDITYVSNQYICSDYAGACNEVGKTYYVVPEEEELDFTSNSIVINTHKYSINVIRIAYGDNTGESLWQLPDTLPTGHYYIPMWIRITVPSVIGVVALVGVGIYVIVRTVKKRRSRKAALIEAQV